MSKQLMSTIQVSWLLYLRWRGSSYGSEMWNLSKGQVSRTVILSLKSNIHLLSYSDFLMRTCKYANQSSAKSLSISSDISSTATPWRMQMTEVFPSWDKKWTTSSCRLGTSWSQFGTLWEITSQVRIKISNNSCQLLTWLLSVSEIWSIISLRSIRYQTTSSRTLHPSETRSKWDNKRASICRVSNWFQSCQDWSQVSKSCPSRCSSSTKWDQHWILSCKCFRSWATVTKPCQMWDS